MPKSINTVVIGLSGGRVTDVLSTDPDIRIVVVDMDVEGSDRVVPCPVDIDALGVVKGDDVILERRTAAPLALVTSNALEYSTE